MRSTEESHFLAVIDCEPQNRAARLVYADWLEERGDPRGALIRIEEEMRNLPIHSDRYWELKPRRTLLHRSAKKPWLRQMKYAPAEYQPIFREIPDGWQERWRLIREFTERWYKIPMADAGGLIPEIPRKNPRTKKHFRDYEFPPIAQHLTDSWPPSVREWFAFIYRLREEKSLDGWFSYFEFGHPDGGQEIALTCVDGFRDGYAVRKEDRQQIDPAVHAFSNALNTVYGSVSPHVTSFAFRYVLECSYHRAGIKETVQPGSIKKLVRVLKDCFPIQAAFDSDQLFERQDMIAVFGLDPFAGGHHLGKPHLHVQVRTTDAPESAEILDALQAQL